MTNRFGGSHSRPFVRGSPTRPSSPEITLDFLSLSFLQHRVTPSRDSRTPVSALRRQRPAHLHPITFLTGAETQNLATVVARKITAASSLQPATTLAADAPADVSANAVPIRRTPAQPNSRPMVTNPRIAS